MYYSKDPRFNGKLPSHKCGNIECSRSVLINEQQYFCPSCYNELKAENENNKRVIIELFKEFGHKESCELFTDKKKCNCGYRERITIE